MKTRGSPGEFLANLRTPLPLREKLPRLLKNRLRALLGGGCCGHPGETGC